MRVIVSSGKSYEGWTTVNRLQDIDVLVGDIDFIVYHKSPESPEDCVKYLSSVMQNHPSATVLYVRDKESVVPAVRILVEGSGGRYIDDEFFLEDSNQLNTLTSQWRGMLALTDLSGVDVLKDFIRRYSQGGSSFTKGYLQVVRGAAENMVTAYNNKSMEMLRLCETASDLFKGSVRLISNIQEEQATLERAVEELRGKLESGSVVGANIPIAPQVGYFPKVSYMKSKVSIVRIKDLCRSPFLTSFVLGFRSYLQYVKRVRPKLVVIEPLGEVLPKVYDMYPWVTQQTKNNVACYSGDVVFTNCPLKDVMDRLLSDPHHDTVIVLDRLLVSPQHILNCAGEEPLFCIKGESFAKAAKVDIKRCFSTVTEVAGSMFTIPVFTEYPKEPDLRERKYLSECGTFYNMLHKVRQY